MKMWQARGTSACATLVRGHVARTALCAVGVIVVLGACAASAWAGTYTVLSCKDRSWARAPLNDASGGWVGGNTGGQGLDWLDHCDDASQGFQATISGPWDHPVGSQVWWRFLPPSGTVIEGADILYGGLTRPLSGGSRGVIFFQGAQAGDIGHHFGEGVVPARWMTLRGLHESWLQAAAQCDGAAGSPPCPGGAVHATIEVFRSEVLLSDTSPPTAGPATGSAAASATWQGTQVFAFPATDDGGGVHQAILSVDGAPVLARTINDWGGRCADTTAGGRVFRYPRPCLTSVDALVTIDANQLPAGDHEVTLQASDAAGNVRTVYAARKTIVVAKRIGPGSDLAERGAANGENASDDARLSVRWARTKRATLTSPYGRRNVIRGQLITAGGAGIRNAKVEMLTAIDGRTGAPLDKGGARTRRDGRFTLILPANVSSRTLVLRYRSHANDTVSIAETTLRVRVKAGVRLRVAPHVAARGHTVRLSGRLVGRPLPATGKVVELQARSPGERWLTFRTLRASRRGRFATRYTFRQSGPALYLMRARVREADDYPYATGVSHAARVRVR
jgi:hypothetical protein